MIGGMGGGSSLGSFLNVYLGRAKEEEILKERKASGGAVTAITLYALENGKVEAIVAAKRTKGLEGEVVIAKTREELLKAAGNSWSIVPFASRLRNRIYEEDLHSVGMVCLPCQAQFFGQMKSFPLVEADFGERISFIISLFCMGTFAFEAFLNYLYMKYGVKGEEISDIKLSGENLEVIHERGVLRIPIKEVYLYLQVGCLVCTDYTGTWADISAGTVSSKPGWTVLITRSKIGEELVNGAKKGGYLEVQQGSGVLGEVLQKAQEKMKRAQQNMMYLLRSFL